MLLLLLLLPLACVSGGLLPGLILTGLGDRGLLRWRRWCALLFALLIGSRLARLDILVSDWLSFGAIGLSRPRLALVRSDLLFAVLIGSRLARLDLLTADWLSSGEFGLSGFRSALVSRVRTFSVLIGSRLASSAFLASDWLPSGEFGLSRF